MLKEEKVISLLIENHQTLAVAESCSGGLLAHRLTNVPKASEAMTLGIVAYSNTAKINLLKVPFDLLRDQGAVSQDVAIAMARGVRLMIQTNFGIGISGIAGPGGGTRAKPVGLVFIAIATEDETLCLKCKFPGTRTQIKQQAATQALDLLLEFLT